MDNVADTADTERDDAAERRDSAGLRTDIAREILSSPKPRRQVSPAGPVRGRSMSAEGPAGAASGGLAEGLPPGYYAKNVSPTLTSENAAGEDERRTSRRTTRFQQRDVLWNISSLERVRKCGRVTNGNEGDGSAAIVLNGEIAHWSGFCTCGSIWACPVCSAKIRAVKADEIARAVCKHINENGGSAWMVTLTARHKSHHDLAPLFDAVANGLRRIMSGTEWAGDKRKGRLGERDRLGVYGKIRAMEVTYGSRNGWHPHIHLLLLLDKVEEENAAESGAALAWAMYRWNKVWQKFLKDKGYEPPSDDHGIKWEKVTTPEEASEYIAKVQEGNLGNEMARGDMKTGRFKTMSPFEILEYIRVTGDMDAVPIFNEYEQGTFKRQAITWSKGLRKQLLPPDEVKEKTDEEIAAEEIGGDKLVLLPADSLRAMRRVPGLQAHLLDVVERGGFVELVRVLTAYHLEYMPGPDAPQDNDAT